MRLKLLDRESLYIESSKGRKLHVFTDNMGEIHTEEIED